MINTIGIPLGSGLELCLGLHIIPDVHFLIAVNDLKENEIKFSLKALQQLCSINIDDYVVDGALTFGVSSKPEISQELDGGIKISKTIIGFYDGVKFTQGKFKIIMRVASAKLLQKAYPTIEYYHEQISSRIPEAKKAFEKFLSLLTTDDSSNDVEKKITENAITPIEKEMILISYGFYRIIQERNEVKSKTQAKSKVKKVQNKSKNIKKAKK